VKQNQAIYPVSVMCRLLKVSAAGFYHWRDRPMSERDRRDVELTALVHQIHESSFDGVTDRRNGAGDDRHNGASFSGRTDIPRGLRMSRFLTVGKL
jgi:hypothetical protein